MQKNDSNTRDFWNRDNNYFLPSSSSQCPGCGSLLAAKIILRTIFKETKDAMVFGRTCGGGRSELQTGGRIGSDGSGMMGIQAGLEMRGTKGKNLVVMTGEGSMLEMGLGDFIASFEREQELTWIILDNQAYAVSGSHITSQSPIKATSRIFTPATHGKTTVEMSIALMMIFAKARYVATATNAYIEDLILKVRKSLQKKPSFLHVIVPCQTSWRYIPSNGVKLSRLLVQTGLLPLWEYNEGVLQRTIRIPDNMREPIQDYLKLQGRFAHITEEDIEDINLHIKRQNKLIDAMENTFNIPNITVSY